jgi:hypothetical protein
MFVYKKGSAAFEHQDYISEEGGVNILAHGRCASDATATEGDCGALVLGGFAHEYLIKPIEDSRADRNLAASKGPSIRHEYSVDGQAMLAFATAVQNARTTYKVDMSQAAEGATRLFCQITWRCQKPTSRTRFCSACTNNAASELPCSCFAAESNSETAVAPARHQGRTRGGRMHALIGLVIATYI